MSILPVWTDLRPTAPGFGWPVAHLGARIFQEANTSTGTIDSRRANKPRA